MKTFTKSIPVLASIFLLFISTNLNAQSKERLQTAFIYQLTRMIEWCPDGKQGNFVIGILNGDQVFINELMTLQTRRVGAQQIEIVSYSSIDNITKPNILFVPNAHFDNVSQISSKVSGFCTLIISDRSGSANRGAGISLNFDSSQQGIVFEMNRKYMSDRSLNVNNQLTNLASRVY
jgi:hypothetical protein